MDRNIRNRLDYKALSKVTLRKESVDRNTDMISDYLRANSGSLSARRAWIEIFYRPLLFQCCAGRSPQGERG